MASFAERIAALEAEGYANATAMARLAHDVVLKALETCGLRDNVTIKGGVVMSNMTGDIRRATMDMDVDFMRYGLTDENIDEWIGRLNCLEGVSIFRSGEIIELRQQNYRGRRVYLSISDRAGVTVMTKLDIGVHVHDEMPQREMPFQISLDESAALLHANTKEQIFAEKLRQPSPEHRRPGLLWRFRDDHARVAELFSRLSRAVVRLGTLGRQGLLQRSDLEREHRRFLLPDIRQGDERRKDSVCA